MKIILKSENKSIDCMEFSDLYTAFDYVKKSRENGIKEHITVKIAGGEYTLSKPLLFRKGNLNVTVEPLDDKKVLLSAGKRINGFCETEWGGVKCLGAFIPEVKSGKWDFTDLYVNSLRADYTRYPETGCLSADVFEVNREDVDMDDPCWIFKGSRWFSAHDGDLDCFDDMRGIIVSFCHYWVDEHTTVESYDPVTKKVTMACRSKFSLFENNEGEYNEGFSYFIENSCKNFKNKNEWYLDRKNGMVYYIPRDDSITAESIEAYAPVIPSIAEFTGDENEKCCGITFKNIDFAYTKGDYVSRYDIDGSDMGENYASDVQSVANAHGSISLTYAENIKFSGCKITNYGVHGIDIKKGCNGIVIENCEFFDGGAGGIKINGAESADDKKNLTFGNTIENCLIKHCGRRYLSACGIILCHSFDNKISHNEITDIFYTGISCGWVWGYAPSVTKGNIIEYNHIYNLGQGRLSDMGGVYLLGCQPGTVVRNNLIHDIKSRSYGGWALYADEGTSDVIFEKNICYNTSDNSFHQHYGGNNTVRNNIFAFSKKPPLRVTRPEEHFSVAFERNIVVTDNTCIYHLTSDQIKNGFAKSTGNLIFDPSGKAPAVLDEEGFKTFADVSAYGFDKGSEIENPLFADIDKRDFTLSDNSPAYKMGFLKIDNNFGRKEIKNDR